MINQCIGNEIEDFDSAESYSSLIRSHSIFSTAHNPTCCVWYYPTNDRCHRHNDWRHSRVGQAHLYVSGSMTDHGKEDLLFDSVAFKLVEMIMSTSLVRSVGGSTSTPFHMMTRTSFTSFII